MQIWEMEEKFQKIFLVLKIIAFQPIVETYLDYDENTCDWQSASPKISYLNNRDFF